MRGGTNASGAPELPKSGAVNDDDDRDELYNEKERTRLHRLCEIDIIITDGSVVSHVPCRCQSPVLQRAPELEKKRERGERRHGEGRKGIRVGDRGGVARTGRGGYIIIYPLSRFLLGQEPCLCRHYGPVTRPRHAYRPRAANRASVVLFRAEPRLARWA